MFMFTIIVFMLMFIDPISSSDRTPTRVDLIADNAPMFNMMMRNRRHADALKNRYDQLRYAIRMLSKLRQLREENDEIGLRLQREASLLAPYAFVESLQCQHEELLSCEDFVTDDRQCYITATGMRCCRCIGQLRIESK